MLRKSYPDVSHDTLPACDVQGNVEWAFCLRGFIVDTFSKSILSKLDDTIWVTKLLNLSDESTLKERIGVGCLGFDFLLYKASLLGNL